VKILAVDKDSYFVPLERKVGLAENGFVVFPIPVPFQPKSLRQQNLVISTLALNGFHVFGTLLFGQNIHAQK
jgi:hypothetical protein